MLEVNLILNVVILAVLVYVNYDKLKELAIPIVKQATPVRLEQINPTCPFCKEEFVGRVRYSLSGHACCDRCLVTVFGNK